ncbi:MAG: HAMP domain-containing sensor histidine kinase, partial [Alloalcanivorax xenomutans]
DKSTFLQYVSHELNTPINWLGAADTLSDDDDRRDTWNLVRKGQQRLMGLVSTSLRYFDLSDRESPTLITVCDPYWLVEALTTSRWECLEQSGLKVQNRVSERLRVRANESELQEVLAMALDNAIRFSPAGEVIDISSQRLDGVGEIRMRDNGRGVGADQLESLFEPFFIMGSRHHEDGFGLSLAMARVMIEQSGGRIWAESTGEGQGFTLVIRLPLAE